MIADDDIDMLGPQQLRQALRAAQAQVAVKSEFVARHERTVAFKQTVIDKLTHEMAVLKRLKFAATSERFSPEQQSLLEEALDEDVEALAREVQLAPLVQAMREDLLSRRLLHADETPVAMLKPGLGKTHRAYLWSYCTTVWDDINAVVFDFAESRAGRHARRFLGIDEDGAGGWRGTLICADYSGYKQTMAAGVTEAG